jgi:hypothetical protein
VDKFNALLQEVARLPKLDFQIYPKLNEVTVKFRSGRRQSIAAQRRRDHYVMTSVVLSESHVRNIGRAQLLPDLWERNRETAVVAFDLDRRGRLVGRIEQLADTLDRLELAFYIELLARECDRFEHVLSGLDVE